MGRLSLLFIEKMLGIKPLRRLLLRYSEKQIFKEYIIKNPDKRPPKVQEDRFFMLRNLFRSIESGVSRNLISPNVRKKIVRGFIYRTILASSDIIPAFIKEHGRWPPLFVTISPAGRCNLACKGCYAASNPKEEANLDWDVLCWIIRQKNRLWGSFFTVISGGEPLLYESNGKTIIDLAIEFPDEYFLMYTNGTLIDEKKAEVLAEAGNITPAISVEGFEEETDKRRGRGVFKKILKAFENLRKVGVPFGCSITATRQNYKTILSDEFLKFYEEQGALYFWIFQYMPIGRAPSIDLMVTPEQRVWMYKRTMYLMRNKGYMIADFWNSGSVSDGCISAGRGSGYFYIDWRGNITPCVFNPYSIGSIYDFYKNNSSLNEIIFCPFFKDIQKWQEEYGYGNRRYWCCNYIMPCPIRDHYPMMRRLIDKHKPKPIDKTAEEALSDPEYYKRLAEFHKHLKQLSQEIWEQECREAEQRVHLAKEQGIDALYAVSEKDYAHKLKQSKHNE